MGKAKRKSDQRSAVSGQTSGGRAVLSIIGDSPLVEEYAELCGSKGYDVVVVRDSKGKFPPTREQKSKAFRETGAIPPETSLALELTNTDLPAKRKNIEQLSKALSPATAILSSSITVTATQQSSWIDKKHRLVGFGALPGFLDRALVEVAPTVFSPPETIEVVRTFFHSLGKEIEIVQDRVGMVLPRILCQIINESIFALQDDVASPADIDTAMKMGVNYPLGPIEWADKIGFKNVYAVLSALEDDMREDRYRVAPLLKQMAEGGDWWKQSGTTS